MTYNFNITINGEDVTAYACYPFSGELTLDRSLDQTYIDLKASPRSAPYTPFSEVVITPNIGEPTTFVIASDEVDTIIKTGLSNHRILLCEETKKLERIICPGKTFVQPLVKSYTNILEPPQNLTNWQNPDERNEQLLTPEQLITKYNLRNNVIDSSAYKSNEHYWQEAGVMPPTINAVIDGGTVLNSVTTTFPSSVSARRLYGYAVLLINHDTGEIVASNLGTINQITNQTPTVTMPNKGRTFDLYYLANFGAENVLPTNADLYATAYQIALKPPTAQKPPLYITDVTNQLLEIAEPIRKGDTPRYTLDAATATKYATTPCAELNLPNGATLREDLDEIAGIVHCITRLKNGVIYFDPVGDPNLADTAKLGYPVSVRSSANLEKYATHLDSFVDNLMNAQDPKQGAISDPFTNVFKTPRALISNTDARVTVSNCRINTTFPIERIEKVEVFYDGNAYDITAFVYEKSEYDLLETNSGVYPYAKAYALYYTQGQKDIDGLTHRVETALFPSFQNYAIANILSVVTGEPLDWTDDIFADAILDYAFNVTYISAVRGRVRAAKKDINDIVSPSALAFNQGAPRLSSVNFGERLKGETAMLSEPEVHLCFKTNDLSAVMDSVGKLYEWKGDRYYISKVTYRVWSGYIIAEMNLSRNFNQLGRFVSINNAFRQFEIDDNSQEECIVYEDYAVFTTTEPTNIPNDSLSYRNDNVDALLGSIKDVVYPMGSGVEVGNSGTKNAEVSMAAVITSDLELNEFGRFRLPVQSLSLGNSLLFNFRFPDNYSAGEFLQPQGGYKLTRAAPYGDPIYGEAKHLAFDLLSEVSLHPNTDPIAFGDALPLAQGRFLGNYAVRTGITTPLIINKTSRDIPNITYQLHHVTDSKLVFGAALTKLNRLVGEFKKSEAFSAYLVALPFEINHISPPTPNNYDYGASPLRIGYGDYQNLPALMPYETAVAISNGVLSISLNYTYYRLKSYLPEGFKPKSFALVGNNCAEFILGANAVDLLDDNGQIKPIYVYLRHNLT